MIYLFIVSVRNYCNTCQWILESTIHFNVIQAIFLYLFFFLSHFVFMRFMSNRDSLLWDCVSFLLGRNVLSDAVTEPVTLAAVQIKSNKRPMCNTKFTETFCSNIRDSMMDSVSNNWVSNKYCASIFTCLGRHGSCCLVHGLWRVSFLQYLLTSLLSTWQFTLHLTERVLLFFLFPFLYACVHIICSKWRYCSLPTPRGGHISGIFD